MKAKRIPPGWDKTGRNGGGGYEPCNKDEYTTPAAEMQELILSFLHKGQENATTARDIRNAAGFGKRAVTLAVREARLNGVPVLSDTSGYWLSDNPGEIRRCARGLRRRSGRISEAADALDAIACSLESGVTV